VRVEFGDGEGRTLDFDVAAKRNVKHVYKKGGSYTVVAKGAGKRPCDGMGQMPLIVQGPPEKKPEAKRHRLRRRRKPLPEGACEEEADRRKGAGEESPGQERREEEGRTPANKKGRLGALF